jgi:hypothetical protein
MRLSLTAGKASKGGVPKVTSSLGKGSFGSSGTTTAYIVCIGVKAGTTDAAVLFLFPWVARLHFLAFGGQCQVR